MSLNKIDIIEKQRIKNDLQEKEIFCYRDDCNTEIYIGNGYYVDELEILCEDCFDKRQLEVKQNNFRIAGDD